VSLRAREARVKSFRTPVVRKHMNLAQLRRYLRDAAVPGWRKFVVAGALAYVLLPIDLVPDLVPLLGWLDDLGALAAAVTFLARDVTAHARAAEARAVHAASQGREGLQLIDVGSRERR
jgi:uncharacterized membrane protein YkvA (DUF1232 family)